MAPTWRLHLATGELFNMLNIFPTVGRGCGLHPGQEARPFLAEAPANQGSTTGRAPVMGGGRLSCQTFTRLRFLAARAFTWRLTFRSSSSSLVLS